MGDVPATGGHMPRQCEAIAGDDDSTVAVELLHDPGGSFLRVVGASAREAQRCSQASRKVDEPEEPVSCVDEGEGKSRVDDAGPGRELESGPSR